MIGMMREAHRYSLFTNNRVKVWIDTTRIDAAEGADVSPLTDRCGVSYSKGAASAPKFTYLTVDATKRRSLEFTTNRGLKSDSNIDFSANPAAYVFLTLTSQDTAAGGFWFEHTNNAYTTTGGMALSLQGVKREDAMHRGAVGGSPGNNEWLVTPVLTVDLLYTFCGRYDYSKAWQLEVSSYRNGVAPVQAQYGTADNGDAGHANSVFNIGMRNVTAAPTQPAKMRLSELFVVIGSLSAAEFNFVSAELRAAFVN